jgi:PAS domain S-box-containing protein
VEDAARELRLYRRLLVFVGGIYLVWWVAVEALLPQAFNPLFGRLLVVLTIWGIFAATYASAWVRRRIQVLWACSLWLITAHYFYLFYENAGGINWVVGSFITVSAISLGMFSRASLVSYSVFAAALSVGVVIAIPQLRQSVFLPGLVTVLLQANVGLQSRLGVIRDLAASNEHFQLLFNSTFEGVLIHEEGRIVQVNDALVRALGFSAAELIGRDVRDLVHPEDRAGAESTLLSGTAITEARGIRNDGTVLDLEIRGKPLPRSKRPTRLLTIADITERNRQAEALRKSNEALERSNIDLQRFAYVASHDLQTPLRSIGSFVDLLNATYEAQLDEQAKDWLRRTSKSVTHLRALIDDLLAYSRVDAEPRAFETVSLRDVVDRATSLLEVAIAESAAQITCGELPEVTGDRSQLVQLVQNLVGNALKYRGAAAPVIHIAAEGEANAWVVSVRDNGIGIAPKHHQQVFEIFKRLHDQKEYPGTGIGLAVCRRVVNRHGGKIWVESEVGQGSVFYFTLAKER